MSDTIKDTKPRPAFGKISFRNRFVNVFLPPTVLVALILVLWELGSITGILNPIIVPSPIAVVQALADLSTQAFFWDAASVTMRETIYGFLIGASIDGSFRSNACCFVPSNGGFSNYAACCPCTVVSRLVRVRNRIQSGHGGNHLFLPSCAECPGGT